VRTEALKNEFKHLGSPLTPISLNKGASSLTVETSKEDVIVD